jgi:hypothetical protein
MPDTRAGWGSATEPQREYSYVTRLVGGDPAVQYDIAQAANRDDLVLIPLVLVVTLVMIALLLQAIVAPLVLVATTALSFGASFGLSSLLWRFGLGYGGIESQIPLCIFVFLVALGVDYNIFLTARIREESAERGIQAGTLGGLSVTGGVITAAGVVLAATFLALTLLPSVTRTEVGTAVAIGVLLDTLLVRTVLVPASLLTLGERAWWRSRRTRTRAAVADPVPEKPAVAVYRVMPPDMSPTAILRCQEPSLTRPSNHGPPIRYAQMRRVLPWMMAVADVRRGAGPYLQRILKLVDSPRWNIAARRALTRRCCRGRLGCGVRGSG